MQNGVVLARNYSTKESERAYAAVIRAGPSPKSLAILHSLPPNQFYNHMPAAELRRKLPSRFWDGAFKFAIERHPYEKVVSMAYMLAAQNPMRLDFDNWVEQAIEGSAFDHRLYFIDGKIAVDQILRYEALDTDLAAVTSMLGLPTLTLPKAKSHYRTDRRPADEILSKRSKRKIVDAFALTFEIMHYQR